MQFKSHDASAPIDGTYRPAFVCENIGVGEKDRWIEDGVLYVRGATQEQLNSAIASFDQQAYNNKVEQVEARRELMQSRAFLTTAKVVVHLIDALVAANVISAQDIPANARADYQRMKTLLGKV